MKVIPVSADVSFIRHWFRWYQVTRFGDEWRRLRFRPYTKKATIESAAASLRKSLEKEKINHV